MDASKRKSEEPLANGSAAKKPKIDVAALRAKIAATKAKASKLPAATGANQAATQSQPAAAAAAATVPAAVAPTGAQQQASASAGADRKTDANAAAADEVTLFDPSLRTRKRKPGLNLFQMGAVPQEHKSVIEDRQAEEQAAAATSVPEDAPALPPEPAVRPVQEPPPVIEWWDAAVLDQPDYEPGPDGHVRLKDNKITDLIEHPVPIEPPVEKPPPPPQALKLTKKEMKKIRKQRREEREKEKQLNIQTGLVEPPSNKVRLANMPRVYGADGVLDATAIELEVKKAQAERQAAHDDRNAARKLTTGERKAKKLHKMFDDASLDTHVQVFRISDMTDGRHTYKVDINAVENRLTGACATTKEGPNVVVVEGDAKGSRRFNRLMLHRIDWNPLVNVDTADDAMFEEPNKCYLVWQGVVAKQAFDDFKTHKLASAEEARALFAQRGVAHYWDAAHYFVPTTEAAAT